MTYFYGCARDARQNHSTTAATATVALVFCLGLYLGSIFSTHDLSEGFGTAAEGRIHSGHSASAIHLPLRLSTSPKKKVFLFIGALSAAENWQRRDAGRTAWADGAQQGEEVITRFFVKSSPVDDAEAAEKIRANLSHDIVPVHAEYDYTTIGVAVLAMFRHVNEYYDSSFLLKTDDDTFVNVPALLSTIRQSCEHVDCKNERLYMGSEDEGKKIVRTGHNDKSHPQFRHDELWDRTHAPGYPKYMSGGGYVLSDDVLRQLFVLLDFAGTEVINCGPEDSGFGYYFAVMKLRRVNSTAFWTRDPGNHGAPNGFPNHEQTPAIMCGNGAPIVIHHIRAPEDMRHLGAVVGNCSSGVI